MRKTKILSVLAVGSMAIGLLLGTSVARAEEEVCLDGDTVIGIKGLDVVTQSYGPITIDVDFKYATGYEIYGSDLDFPWEYPYAEDAFTVLTSINNALSSNNPVPGFAGVSGQNAYYIGGDDDIEGFVEFVLAVGGENITGGEWDTCDIDCTIGIAILEADERFVYADLSRASGNSCDNVPGPSFTITPGITGTWYDPARDGEGYNIEIIGSSLDPQMLAYFYTYDDAGNQMWLIAQGPVDGDTATLPAFVASGAVFGPGFDPDDVDLEEWGTLTFTFTSCAAGTATYDSTMGFGTGTANIVRLSSVTGLACP